MSSYFLATHIYINIKVLKMLIHAYNILDTKKKGRKDLKTMQIEEKQTNIMQNVILENRKKLTLTGIRDVLSFDDEIVVVESELGLLNIKGTDLRVNKISVETGDVIVDGTIKAIEYSDKDISSKQGLMSKIFK